MSGRLRPSAVRFEQRSDALGIGIPTPRLSWTMSAADDGWRQAGFEVMVAIDGTTHSTGRVHSGDSVLVDWPFRPLMSRQRADVRVRVWGAGDEEPSAWSDSSAVEVGLLEAADWRATAIATAGQLPAESTARFRRSFDIATDIVAARLYITALGIFTAELNGAPVGHDLLAPGWTVYSHRLRYLTYDVTDLLRVGANAIGITVAEGWYKGRVGFRGGVRDLYGDRLAGFAQLEITHADGSAQLLATDATWSAGPSPITLASLYDGETYDARLDDPTWSTSAADASGWAPVEVLAVDLAGRLEAPLGPMVRRHELFAPERIWRSPSGATLVDFGQNVSGRVRITLAAPAGTPITLRHAEVLEDGELGVRPLRQAAQTDTFIAAGVGLETYEPTFTIHGFRYVQVDGWPGELAAGDIVAIACYSAVGDDGSFDSSHDGLNQLHRNVRWSMKGNFVDLPTDCPQRDERLGWTGDIQAFAATAAYLGDCAGFLGSWLKDLAIEQERLGVVPPYVPWVPLLFPPMGTAAWSDAAVIVPWTLYEQYGDAGVLRQQYPSMKAWVEATTTMSSPSGLWDRGFQFGDWLDPVAPPDSPAAARTEPALVATAYRALSARLLGFAAKVLGHHADAQCYTALAAEVTEAFNHEFVSPSGRLSSDAQTAYAIALRFDLLPSAAQRARAGQRLRDLVAAEGHRIGTGFLGTPLVCDALADTGHIDDAYLLLLQTACPSWLYPVSMGATTVWERWDSMLADGSINPGQMTSFNHYALGAVADFLHRRVAGLAPAAPGYRHLLVHPLPGGGLSRAATQHRTPYGEAAVSWARTGAALNVEVTVPPSTTATVRLADTDPIEVGSGRHSFAVPFRPVDEDLTTPPRPPHPFDPPSLPDEEQPQ